MIIYEVYTDGHYNYFADAKEAERHFNICTLYPQWDYLKEIAFDVTEQFMINLLNNTDVVLSQQVNKRFIQIKDIK